MIAAIENKKSFYINFLLSLSFTEKLHFLIWLMSNKCTESDLDGIITVFIRNENMPESTVASIVREYSQHFSDGAKGILWKRAFYFAMSFDECGDIGGENGKINAIKEVRMLTGLGLKEAKDLIEKIRVLYNSGQILKIAELYKEQFKTTDMGAMADIQSIVTFLTSEESSENNH